MIYNTESNKNEQSKQTNTYKKSLIQTTVWELSEGKEGRGILERGKGIKYVMTEGD